MGKTTVDPASFHYIQQTPVRFFDIFRAIPQGLMGAGSIVFLILFVGGAVEAIDQTNSNTTPGHVILSLDWQKMFEKPSPS